MPNYIHPTLANGTVTLVDGSTVVLNAGRATVTPAQEEAAINSGMVRNDPNTPYLPIRSMAIPSTGAWPTNGTITSPDGATITITAGKAPIPAAWANYYMGLGFKPAGNV